MLVVIKERSSGELLKHGMAQHIFQVATNIPKIQCFLLFGKGACASLVLYVKSSLPGYTSIQFI